MKNSPSRLVLALCAAFASTTVCAADAPYPEKAVRMIVPFAPGGPTDVIARVVAAKLSEAWNNQVVVDNRAGAGTIIGIEIAAKAPPDGYTILMGLSTLAINPSMYTKLPYDAMKDFQPVSLVANVPFVLVVSASSPIASLKDYVAAARVVGNSNLVRLFFQGRHRSDT